jgi:hypothetical protein
MAAGEGFEGGWRGTTDEEDAECVELCGCCDGVVLPRSLRVGGRGYSCLMVAKNGRLDVETRLEAYGV